jgi:hypothetical protein
MSETNQINEAVLEGNKPQEKYRGKGEVGTATPSLAIKNLWHAEKQKMNENRRLSLKKFAKMLAGKKDPVALTWLANKSGQNNEDRSDKTKSRISAEKLATRAGRRSSSSNKSKAKASAEEAPSTIITKR